jgi:hypothetical protein
MAASPTIRRRGAQAAAAERAAKERRQLYMVIGLGVLLLIVLAVEVLPRLTSGGSTQTATTPPPAVTTPAVSTPASRTQSTGSVVERRALRRALRQPASDPFAGAVTGTPSTLGSVPNPPGLHDPFASTSSPEAATAPVATKPAGPAIKGTIVIGTPGAGTVAEHGWIVILASIPTAKGKSAATSFAAAAKRAGVGSPSILNSSNRRPLRGGYWVVYTGPFGTLGQVNHNASTVHARGFTSAYIRQLIVYKKKG